MTTRELEDFAEGYYEWLCESMGCYDGYTRLFETMYSTEFVWSVANDENRAIDGIDLRVVYGNWVGIDVPPGWSEWPCSFLEMVIGLAYRMNEIMYEAYTGDRTAKYFWKMMHNAGLDRFSDSYLKERPTGARSLQKRIDTIIYRGYDEHGSPGLFPNFETKKDLRKVELWYQMQAAEW